MSSHTVAEVAEKFEEYAARVADQGEPMIVTRDGRPLGIGEFARVPGLRVIG